MKSHASLVAQQTRLREWAELVKDCQNRPQGKGAMFLLPPRNKPKKP